MVDWVAVGIGLTALVAVLGAAGSYGVMRQKVADLTSRVKRGEADLQRVWLAVEGINHTNQAVTALQGSIETLTTRMEAGHTLMLTKLEASDRFTGQRLDDLAKTVQNAARQGTKTG